MSETDPTHEQAVREFMDGAREEDPERVVEVEARYPVLSETELDWRRSREVRLTEAFENTLSLSADIFGRRIAAPLVFGRTAMRTIGIIAAVAMLALAACSASPLGAKSPAHGCADKVAQLAVDGQVPGLWACLDETLQQEFAATGQSDFVIEPFAASWRYVGQSTDQGHTVQIYEVTYTAEVSAKADGDKGQIVIVYVDPDGKVWGVGVAQVVL